ncbi:hybrid sensor histidine kinase/response regulator [Allocoleopsis franciscana]|uniref:histidine kinase n=1 Tax=Allocoleopsis franciscana PCC 7113 TaxID=1173027 RepID=K9WG05_9CYAN|nr:response regulator [Allocoleopsis franciscana]AFZ19118.1 response regulator with CheY-like receiver domain and winged-helix DNA-binding domain [Allocoleopsis franciscana PCC 7113]
MTKILVIEDEDDIRESLEDILTAENFEVITAENGRIGMQLAQENVPDLIICDIMMPDLDGYGVVEQLRQSPSTATVPFIFLTAKATPVDRRQGMELGADDFLTKPFTIQELLRAISARLKKQVAFERKAQSQLDELRGNITHALPHELNTPLNGILSYSGLLFDDYDSFEREEVLEMLQGIHTSAQRLYRLTQNFLLSAELELIATNPERVRSLRSSGMNCNTQRIITDIATQTAKSAKRESDLQLELQEAIAQISELRFKKIVEEIVDNAFKFSTPGTSVRVISFSDNNTYNLHIIDQGRGMTQEQIANMGVYMQFERKLYEQQGFGLGLSLAKRLIELYGGKLIIDSIPEQQTSMNVALPMATSSL